MITILAVFALGIGLITFVISTINWLSERRRFNEEKRLVDALYNSIVEESASLSRQRLQEVREQIGNVSIATCAAAPSTREKVDRIWMAVWEREKEFQAMRDMEPELAREEALRRKEWRILLRQANMHAPSEKAKSVKEDIESNEGRVVGENLLFPNWVTPLASISKSTAQALKSPAQATG